MSGLEKTQARYYRLEVTQGGAGKPAKESLQNRRFQGNGTAGQKGTNRGFLLSAGRDYEGEQANPSPPLVYRLIF